MVPNSFINEIFYGTDFGDEINKSVKEKKRLIAVSLDKQLDGYWSGHTIYWILVNGGFLKDAKSTDKKELTAFGNYFMADFDNRSIKCKNT